MFTSKLFTFVVGEDKKAVTVHSEAIAKHSRGLDILMNGKMSEAENGKTTLGDVLEDTFIRFCQFAYTGDYVTPDFTHDEPKPESLYCSPSGTTSPSASLTSDVVVEVVAEAGPPEEPPLEVVSAEVAAVDLDTWSNWGQAIKKTKSKASKSIKLRRELDKKVYDINAARSESLVQCDIRENKLSEEDYTSVFLGHARLYVFAEKWGIEPLKILSLYKLHRTLITFTLFEARRRDIVQLATFAYSNDNTPDRDDIIDDLRALVIHYITCNLESLIEAPEFNHFLEQSGQFSRDLVKKMMKRIE